MNKQEFLGALRKKLAPLPEQEIERSLAYYSEIIDDRMEDGMTEADAVAALGDPGAIAETIMYDMSIPALMKARASGSRSGASNKTLWLVLVILGFPLWFPSVIAIFSVIAAVYITVWALIISLYAIVLSLAAAADGRIAAALAALIDMSAAAALMTLGLALCCGALTIFMIKPVYLITRALLGFTGRVIRKIKSLFVKNI